MLCITLKDNESVTADGPCVFTVLERRGNQTRVGCEAPRTTTILRTELVGRDKKPRVDHRGV